MNNEQSVWKGSPSQVLNLPALLLGAVVAGAVTAAALIFALPFAVPIIIAAWVVCLLPWAWKALNTKFYNYELTNERLKLSTGVLNRKTDVLELYRVKDMELEKPLHFRIFGLSRLILTTSDRTTPTVVLNAIRQGDNVSDTIRHYVEELRDKKRVREVDFEGDDMDGDDLA